MNYYYKGQYINNNTHPIYNPQPNYNYYNAPQEYHIINSSEDFSNLPVPIITYNNSPQQIVQTNNQNYLNLPNEIYSENSTNSNNIYQDINYKANTNTNIYTPTQKNINGIYSNDVSKHQPYIQQNNAQTYIQPRNNNNFKYYIESPNININQPNIIPGTIINPAINRATSNQNLQRIDNIKLINNTQPANSNISNQYNLNPKNKILMNPRTDITKGNTKIIPIPNNKRKENIIINPNLQNNTKNIKKKESLPTNQLIKNNIPNEIHAEKGNNVEKIITQDNNKFNNPVNNTQPKQLVENHEILKNEENKPINNIINKNIENIPLDNNPKVIEEITDGIENIEIIPTNNIQNRPLTQDDYNTIFIMGIGIINLGNTCFINSCLQALIHCKLFMQTFFKKYSEINEKSTPVSYNFLLICIAMLDNNKNSNDRYIDISYFKYIFGKKHALFNGYAQNDSQEFCRIFLEDISTELNEIKNKYIYKALTNSPGKTKIDRDKEFHMNFISKEKSIITDLFYSQIITTFICKCNSEIYSFQKLLDFPLLLPENVNKIDIVDLLKIYFKEEIVDFETKCEACQHVEKHKKLLKISRPPEILILSFQRIDETTQKKNDCQIIFPINDTLKLYDFIDHDIGFDKESHYKLFSIVNHIGNMNGGHYFTYIRPLESQKWYEFNDSSVRQIQLHTSVYQTAYALFYIKNKYK